MHRLKVIFGLAAVVVTLVACAPTPTSAPTPSPTATAPPPTSAVPTPAEGQRATVTYVVDGDTVELADGRRVRYIGINTPERDQPFYQEATDLNRRLVEGKDVTLEFDLDTFDRYGRTLAYVFAGDVFVNLEIVRQGYASVYTVPPNVKYDRQFLAAQREAREAGRGLWATVPSGLKITALQADAPGKDKENPNGEWVEITNQGETVVNMKGFTLKDEANHIYTFPDVNLAPGASVRLYSGMGQDTEAKLYWGFVGKAVWNNGGDTAFLRDAQGNLVDVYGY